MKYFLIICCLFTVQIQISYSQSATLPVPETEKPKVALLGTFHFGKTTDMAAIIMEDVLGEKRQGEIQDLVELLAEYQPTKILVEYPFAKQDTLQYRYQLYLQGELPPTANETYQVGFRLAKQLGHTKIFGIDYRMNLPFETLMKYCEENNHMEKMQSFIDQIRSYTAKESEVLANQELALFLHNMNTDEIDRMSRKIYIQDMLNYGDPENEVGIDFTLAWYQRNMIMMNHILRTIEYPTEKILVIVGGAHRAIIKQFLLDREDVEYIEIGNFLKD